jgi:ParB family chromosome partitioning protein
MESHKISISKVKVSIGVHARARALRPERVAALVESIGELGLRTPITVVPTEILNEKGFVEPGYQLVVGLHRLEACKLLGQIEIEAFVVDMPELDRQLWEIDENLIRVDLTELEIASHLKRRKDIYIARHPETRQGGAPGKAGGGKLAKTDKLSSFAQDTAVKTGCNERTIRRAVRRAERIDPDVQDRIDGTPIADCGADLDALASIEDRRDQIKAVRLVERGKAATIREAKAKLNGASPSSAPQTDARRLFARTLSEYLALPAEAQQEFLEHLRDWLGKAAAEIVGDAVCRHVLAPQVEVAVASLPKTTKEKFDVAIRQEKKRLAAEFDRAVQEELKKAVDEVVLPTYNRKMEEANAIVRSRKGHMTRETFRLIWSCLHPDRVADDVLKAKYTQAFHAFSKMELSLCNEKEMPTTASTIPRSYEEMMKRRDEIRAEKARQRAAR